jgi:hypothetical protein
MANMITRTDAERIATKLGAVLEDGKKKSGGAREHTRAVVYHDDLAIAWFGIRRGSSREQPHGHVPSDLQIGPHFCREIAICNKNKADYLAELRRKGLLAND